MSSYNFSLCRTVRNWNVIDLFHCTLSQIKFQPALALSRHQVRGNMFSRAPRQQRIVFNGTLNKHFNNLFQSKAHSVEAQISRGFTYPVNLDDLNDAAVRHSLQTSPKDHYCPHNTSVLTESVWTTVKNKQKTKHCCPYPTTTKRFQLVFIAKPLNQIKMLQYKQLLHYH